MNGSTNNAKYNGRIVQWDEMRRFGFTETIEELPFGGTRIFTHQSNSMETLSLGLYITFEVGKPYILNRSPQAVRIMIVKTEVVEPINGEVSPETGAQTKAVN